MSTTFESFQDSIEQFKLQTQQYVSDHTTGIIVNFFNDKLAQAGDWLKPNSLELFQVSATCVICYFGGKIFFKPEYEKDFANISVTVLIYTIIRLFWRVKFHV